MKQRLLLCLIFCTLVLTVASGSASAYMLLVGDGVYGDFTGVFTYNSTDSSHATLNVLLRNTSPADNGGYVTGFAFNNPHDQITNVILTATDPDFQVIGGKSFKNKIAASPYGDFDIGSSISGSFNGTGKPQPGMTVGAAETFTFALTGVNLNLLNELSFVNELSSNGEGGGDLWFLARFKGFNDGNSDKVLGLPFPSGSSVPLPGTLLLLSSGLIGLGAWARWKRR